MTWRWAALLVLGACGEVTVVFPGEDAGAPPCGAGKPCAAPLVCDVSGACVECTTDGNCSGANPACDPVTKRCVPCRGSVGCSAPYVCSPTAPFCVLPCIEGSSGTCPGFIESCKAGGVCASCNEADDCAAGMFCDVPHGRCVACLSDTDCAGGKRCDQGTGQCEACLSNADCPGGGACFQGNCRSPF